MDRKVIQRFLIPKCSGATVRVDKGQILRVSQVEGQQVAGLIILNAHNYKEQGMARYSGDLSQTLGIGNQYGLGAVFSKVPYENRMLTVTYDAVGHQFLGPHCSRKMMEIWGAAGHRSCSDNYEDALGQIGLTLEDVFTPASVNLFANVRVGPTGPGMPVVLPPVAKAGDYIDLTAEIDLVVAISACPDDVSAMNGHSCKPIGIEILQ